VIKPLVNARVSPMLMAVNATGVNGVSLDIRTVDLVSAVDVPMSVMIRVVACRVVTTLVECDVKDVPTVTMVIHGLVLLSRAVLVCAQVGLEVDSNMVTRVDMTPAIIKSRVIVVPVTVV
jgi:hypothetical protein